MISATQWINHYSCPKSNLLHREEGDDTKLTEILFLPLNLNAQFLMSLKSTGITVSKARNIEQVVSILRNHLRNRSDLDIVSVIFTFLL